MAGLADNVGTYGSSRTWQVESNNLTSQAGAISRSFAAITFAALLASTVALNAFKIGGFPIRGVVAAGILVLAIIFYFDEAKLALRRNLALLGLAAGLAVLGVFVSLVNGAALKRLSEVWPRYMCRRPSPLWWQPSLRRLPVPGRA